MIKLKKLLSILSLSLVGLGSIYSQYKMPLSEDQYYTIHDTVNNGGYVGPVRLYANIEGYYDSTYTMSIVTNSDGIYALSDSMLYVLDNTNLAIGHDTISIRITKTNFQDDTINAIVRVVDADASTFLTSLDTWPTTTSNHYYFFLRGDTILRNTSWIFDGVSDVYVGAYGIGNAPRIVSENSSTIFRGYGGCDSVIIQNLEISPTDVIIANPTHSPGTNTYFTNWTGVLYFNNYTDANWHDLILSHCYFHHVGSIAPHGGSYGSPSSNGSKFTYCWNTNTDNPLDGVFIQNVDSGIFMYGNYSFRNNRTFDFESSETYANGDPMQTYHVDSGYIHHNYIDKSETGQKFMVIYDQASSAVQSSGTLDIGGRYTILTTQTDHFGVGVQAGDIITADAAYVCDVNNTAAEYLDGLVRIEDNVFMATPTNGAIQNWLWIRYPQVRRNLYLSPPGYQSDYAVMANAAISGDFSYNIITNGGQVRLANIDYYNNLVIDPNSAVMTGGTGFNDFRNNLIKLTDTSGYVYNRFDPNGVISNNFYSQENTNMFGTGYNTLADIQGVGFEANSQVVDFWYDTDFTSDDTSAANKAGVVVGQTLDFYYNPVGDSVSVGNFQLSYYDIVTDTVTCDSTVGSADSTIYSNNWQNWSYDQPLTDSIEWISGTTLVPRVDTAIGGTDFIVTHTVGAGHQIAYLDYVFDSNQFTTYIQQFSSGLYTGTTVRTSGSGGTLNCYGVRTNNTNIELFRILNGVIDTIEIAGTPALGSTIKLEVRDTFLYVYDDDVLIIDTSDAAISNGSTGIYAYGTYPNSYNQLDDYTAGDLGSASLPIIKAYGDVTNSSGLDGSIDITAYCGTSPYTYLWSNTSTTEDLTNLAAGDYWVIVTDYNGIKSDTIPFTVLSTISYCDTTSNLPVIGYTAYSDTVLGGVPQGVGAITINVTGGVGTIDYSWLDGPATQNRSGLYANTYYLTVTDDSTCTDFAGISVDQYIVSVPCDTTTLIIVTDSIINPTESALGAIYISVAGGVTPYIYSWSNGPTTQDITNLLPGSYTVIVTDANGCTGIKTIGINGDSPSIDLGTPYIINIEINQYILNL